MMLILIVVFIILDIVSKLLVIKSIYLNQSIIVIKNFFSITYVKNTGAAWSILNDKGYLVLIISGIIIFSLVSYLYKYKPSKLIEKIAYSMILGGAISNFFDRIINGYVIDFIDINILGYDYPIFNLADCFIVIGVILLLVYAWRCDYGNRSCR